MVTEANTRVREEFGRLWRGTFVWPQGSSGKPQEGKAGLGSGCVQQVRRTVLFKTGPQDEVIKEDLPLSGPALAFFHFEETDQKGWLCSRN